MRSDNIQLLAPGMAFTVEPGIYLAGHTGVPIENKVVITEYGTDRRAIPKALTQIALAAKRHWGYPERWIEIWSSQLTFSP